MSKCVRSYVVALAVIANCSTSVLIRAEESTNEPRAVRVPLRPQTQCIPESEQQANIAIAQASHFEWKGAPLLTLFADPIGGGGTHAAGNFITNYVDRAPGGSILDYECGDVAYNGHNGTDMAIIDWYQMDEGVAVLCAAPGLVIESADGFFDRCTSGFSPCCGPANRVLAGC